MIAPSVCGWGSRGSPWCSRTAAARLLGGPEVLGGGGWACAGGGRRAVAVQGLGAVGGAGFGGAVGVQGQGPAEPVHAYVMVVGTEQQQILQPGLAAAGA